MTGLRSLAVQRTQLPAIANGDSDRRESLEDMRVIGSGSILNFGLDDVKDENAQTSNSL
jgi:hypothetical protein